MASISSPLAVVSPELAARHVRALRLAMIDAIRAHLTQHTLSQAELADLIEISRPRLNRLFKRDVEIFGLDSLAAIAARVGLTVRVSLTRRYRPRR